MYLHSDGMSVSRWERPISENKYIRLPYHETYIPVIQPSIANGPVLSHENYRSLGTYYNTNEQNLPHLENFSQDNYDNQIVKDVPRYSPNEQYQQRFIYAPPYKTISQSLRVWALAENGTKKLIRVFIDNGSQLSIISRELMHELKLDDPKNKCCLAMSCSGGLVAEFPDEYLCNIRLESIFGDYLSPIIECCSCEYTTADIQKLEVSTQTMDHLKNINNWTDRFPMTNHYYEKNKKCSLLLGEPFASRIITGITHSPSIELPSAMHSVFGSFLCGSIGMSVTELPEGIKETRLTYTNQLLYRENEQMCKEVCSSLKKQFEQFFSLECCLGIPDIYTEKSQSFNEIKADQIMAQFTTYSATEKQYTTTLPWAELGPPSCSNKTAAYASAISCIKKLYRHQQKWQDFINAFNKLKENKFIECVPKKDLRKNSKFCYLSWSCVFKNSKTSPCRIVYNCNQPLSCNCEPTCPLPLSSQGRKKQSRKTINDYQLKGADLLNNLAKLKIRFRKATYAASCDISAMYSRIKLDQETRDYTRFYMTSELPDADGNFKLQSYRNTGVAFGLKSAPYVCSKTLKFHAEKYLETPLRLSAIHILENIYMDDQLYFAENSQQMTQHTDQLKQIFDSAGLPTQKFNSNCSTSLKNLSKDLVDSGQFCTILGIKWNKISDNLSINFFKPPRYKNEDEYDFSTLYSEENSMLFNEKAKKSQEEKWMENIIHQKDIEKMPKFTKRQALSLISKIYDVTGLVAPFVFAGRLIMKQTWEIPGLDWNSVLPDVLQEKMKLWASQLWRLHDFVIPRCLTPNCGKIVGIHTTCDASLEGMATNVFIVSVSTDGSTLQSRLAFCKTKVKPKKVNIEDNEASICRLELVGAQMAAQASNFVLDALKLDYEPKRWYFSDSQVSLYRISKPEKYAEYKLFTYNRLQLISKLSNTNNWFYIDTKVNQCSDQACRGANLDQFIYCDIWKSGPKCFTEKDYIPVRIGPFSDLHKAMDKIEKKATIPACRVTRLFKQFPFPSLDEDIDRKGQNLSKKDIFDPHWWEDKEKGILYRYSSYRRMINVLAWIKLFITKCKKAVEKKVKKVRFLIEMDKNSKKCQNKFYLPAELLQKALASVLTDTLWTETNHMVFRYSQEAHFSAEIALLQNGESLNIESKIQQRCTIRKKMYHLLAFWDDHTNLLRIKSRTPNNCKFPIILPSYSMVTWLYLRQIHYDYLHCGISELLFHAGKEVIIIGGRRFCSSVLKGCLCRSKRDLYTQQDTLPPWRYLQNDQQLNPKETEKTMIPYYIVGLDFCGPFWTKDTENGQKVKSFVLVLSCLYSRHITALLCKSCNTNDVILCLRELVSTRGAFSLLFCDSAKCFLKASRQMRIMLSKLEWDKLRPPFDRFRSKMVFNCPRSSHSNGINEIAVKLFKKCLRNAVGNSLYDYESLRVLCHEASAVCNERILTYVTTEESFGGKDVMVSPSELVNGRRLKIFPHEFNPELNENQKLQYKLRKKTLEKFWKDWECSYFAELSCNKKWPQKLNFTLKKDMYVYLKEPHPKRNKFIYTSARILDTEVGRNGLVNKVHLKVAGFTEPVKRHVSALAMLELDFITLQNESSEQVPVQDFIKFFMKNTENTQNIGHISEQQSRKFSSSADT